MSNVLKYLNQYVFDHTIAETGQIVKFRPITTGQLKTLLTYENEEDIGTVDNMLDGLINGCIITEGFDIDGLTIQDRFDLLLDIRRKSKGDSYSFTVKCKECKTPNIINVDLKTLINRPFNKEQNKVIKINDDLSIELDYIRRRDQKFIYGIDKTKDSDSMRIANLSTALFAISIKKFFTPDGVLDNEDFETKCDFVDALDTNTYSIVTDWHQINGYGTDFTYSFECIHCSHKEKESIPITSFF